MTDTDTDRGPENAPKDDRSDIEQVVQARSDAADRGEGGTEPNPMTSTGDHTGSAGTGGEVKNQNDDAQ